MMKTACHEVLEVIITFSFYIKKKYFQVSRIVFASAVYVLK